MKSHWSDKDAKAAERKYARQGANKDLALRVYTTRLLGSVPDLVLHGGGNSSVKTWAKDVSGKRIKVLCVKGSGWDMGSIEPPGLPAVRLEPLGDLRALPFLSDEDMVNVQRANLIDSNAPNPSVETLLHAFLPHKFVDHTHANAVLSLTDQPDGAKLAEEVYGNRAALVPYIMPGFDLAKSAGDIFDANPDVEGLILLKHGIFTFGDTAKHAYERMIDLVSLAEKRLAKKRRKVFIPLKQPSKLANAAEIAPIIRGLVSSPTPEAAGGHSRWVLAHRSGKQVLNFVNGKDLSRYSQAGVITPDHVIRVKPSPLILPAPEAGKLDEFTNAAQAALGRFQTAYHTYFQRHNKRHGGAKTELDRLPRIVLVPGVGLFALGKNAKDASVAADIAEANIAATIDAEAIGRYQPLPPADLFDIEYWSLEQAKLGKGSEPSLARQIVVVTGGAGGIGRAIAQAFTAEGATVAILDKDEKQAKDAAETVGGLGVGCDVTDPASVKKAFRAVCRYFGGVDILVSNAGAAWQGKIGEVDDKTLRASFELNFFAHQNVAKEAVRVMNLQTTGGCLLFNVSKQALNPGQNFGPYGLPKAATLHLMKQYAVDYGAQGIRSNAVNADRVRSGLLTDEMIADRSTARGVSEADYMAGNLLGREVRAADVAKAFISLALAERSTGAVMTVDGGNIAAAPR